MPCMLPSSNAQRRKQHHDDMRNAYGAALLAPGQLDKPAEVKQDIVRNGMMAAEPIEVMRGCCCSSSVRVPPILSETASRIMK